jgi:signal transduction histidine kinase/CheY-like chemotaxis protein
MTKPDEEPGAGPSAEPREDASAAGTGTPADPRDTERLNVNLREANEQLVVATVEAQIAVEHADEVNRLKDDFLATVSHELRTPLNAVLGWAQMVMSKRLPPDREAHAMETIERNAKTLAHLIDDLLDVSRIIAGTLRLTLQPVDVVAVTRAAVEAVKPLAADKHIDLRFPPEPGPPVLVSGDGDRLQQVIRNLLVNAVKFTPDSGRIDVSINRAGSTIEVTVADTGQGISPEFLPHLFERFSQGAGTPSRRHGGLGLGLAIVRQLVDLHGGTVHAASRGIGTGSTLTVRLPILDGGAGVERGSPAVASRTAASPASDAEQRRRLAGLTVLVVEDQADDSSLTELVLTQMGARVHVAHSAREALQLLDVQRPNVMVTKIGLPEEDGYWLLRQIRQREAEHGGFLPAIALTAYARLEDRARALEAGFQAFLTKPVELAELTAAIAAVTGLAKPSRQGSEDAG